MRRIARLAALTTALVMVAAGATSAAGAGCTTVSSSGAVTALERDLDFYTPPAGIRGKPGAVLKHELSTFFLDPLRLVNVSARVRRLMYVSTGTHGEPTAITGTLLTPTAAWSGPGSRPLISYALGTVGMADRCAPSRQMAAGTLTEGALIQALLSRGYAVVATDYQGLGTPGTHTYLDAAVLGRNVLDAARAAMRTPVDRVPADARVLVAGYSEGGTAAAGALEQQPTYAPRMRLIGGYVGAPAVSLPTLGGYIDGGPYSGFLVEAMAGLADNHPELHIDALLNRAGTRALEKARTTCVIDGGVALSLRRTANLTREGESFVELMRRPDIAQVVRAMSLGHRRPDAPVFTTHSFLDDIAPFAPHRAAARAWCRMGGTVDFQTSLVPGHIPALVPSAMNGFAFLARRIDGEPAVSACDQKRETTS